jgi:hypothetical protein
MGETRHGFLVLADISGFTAFVTATEPEHGPPIIAALLEEVIRRIAPPLEVREIEGDAVFALGPHGTVLPPASLLDVLHAGLLSHVECYEHFGDVECFVEDLADAVSRTG